MKKQPDYRLPVFPSVLYSGQDGEPLLCRLIIFDEEMGKLVLYDLTLVAGKVKRDFMVVDSDGTDFVVVEDSVSTGRMLKQRAWEAYHVEVERLEQMPTELIGGPGVPKLTVRDEASWHRDWSYVKQITGPRTRIEKKTAYEFYADAKWRKQVFARLKERLHASVKYISDAFWNSVHFGGDVASVMPRTDESGAGGSERPAVEGQGRTGRPPRALAERPERGPDGLTTAWRDRIFGLFIEQLRGFWSDETRCINVEAARTHFRAKRAFFQKLRERYYTAESSEEERNSRPTEALVTDHLMRVLLPRISKHGAELEQTMREEKGVAGRSTRGIGTTRQRGAGVLKTIWMDGTLVGNVMLVLYDPETGLFRDVGKPTVVLAASAKPEVILGWSVSPWPEDGEMYRDALCCALSEKLDRLLELGIDPATATGIVRGYGDGIVTDRKPGMRFALWVLDEVTLNSELTLPWVPEQKGQIEGVNSRVKRVLDGMLGWQDYLRSKFPGSVITLDQVNKALPRGAAAVEKMIQGRRHNKAKSIVIRMTLRAFERLLVECINRLNNRPLSAKTRTRNNVINRLATPAEVYRHAMKDRVGAQGKALRSARDLSFTVLESKKYIIDNGQINVRNCFYGMGASINGERDKGAEALRDYINSGGREIWVKRPSNGMSVIWVRGVNDYVTLRATSQMIDKYGGDADQFDIDATIALDGLDQVARDQADYKPLNDAPAEEAREINRQVQALLGPRLNSAQQGALRTGELNSKKEAQFQKALDNAKQPTKTTTPLIPTSSFSEEVFKLADFHSTLSKLYESLEGSPKKRKPDSKKP